MCSAQALFFQIFVKAKRGKSITIWVNNLNTINEVKAKIAFKENIPEEDHD